MIQGRNHRREYSSCCYNNNNCWSCSPDRPQPLKDKKIRRPAVRRPPGAAQRWQSTKSGPNEAARIDRRPPASASPVAGSIGRRNTQFELGTILDTDLGFSRGLWRWVSTAYRYQLYEITTRKLSISRNYRWAKSDHRPRTLISRQPLASGLPRLGTQGTTKNVTSFFREMDRPRVDFGRSCQR